MSTKLIETREKLAAKQKELHALFEAYPDLDMPAEVAEDIKTRNNELTTLGEEHDRLRDLDGIAQKSRERHELLNTPAGGMIHPTNPVEEKAAAAEYKSPGQLFIESEAYTGYSSTLKRGPVSDVKELILERKALLDTVGWVPEATRTGRIQPAALRTVRITDLLPAGTTNQSQIVYLEETTTTNAAAPVAEAALKPESALAFTERNAAVRKIATVLPVTDELMADEPAMRSYVDARLRLFLDLAEENQIINGTGVAPQMTGLYNVAGIQTQAKGTDPTPDAIYKAMIKIETGAFLAPEAVVIHPLDWQDIRLLRTADGMYIWGSPAEAGPERIWGLPVVSTTAATLNTALVANLSAATQYFRREGVSFAVSDQHADFFVTNKLMLRVEMRGVVVVYRPAALCTVSGV